MDRQELKLVGSKIADGCFEEILDILEKRSDYLTQKQALYLIVCCCTTCNSNMNNCNKLNEEKLVFAVTGLSKLIITITSDEYDNYVQSIYFICKLLMKKNYQFILEVKHEILPDFMPKILTQKQKSVYKSICDLIIIEIVDLATNKSSINKKKIMSIGKLLGDIIITSSNYTIFMDYIFKYAFCLPRLNTGLDLQYDYFLYSISKMKDLPTENLLQGVSQFLKFGLHLFSSFLTLGMQQCSHQCIEEILGIIPKDGEWIDLREILKICKYIIQSDTDNKYLVDSRDILMKSFKLYRKSENLNNICKLLSQVMVSYSNFCKSCDKKIYSDPEKHMIIYEILSLMMEILLQGAVPCTKECKCLSKSNSEVSDVALCILILFASLLNTNDIAKDYIKKVNSFLKKYFEFLLSQKNNKCEGYKKSWSDAAPYLHNVGVMLFRKENYEQAISMGNITLKYHSLLGTMQESVIIPSTFNLLSSICSKQKAHKEALIWTAMEIINTKKDSRNKVFCKWIKIKAASKEESPPEIQELTIISAIKTIPKEYKCYVEHIQTREAQIELLISELEMYHAKWKSKVPMMSSFRHICQIGDKRTIMKIFVNIFTDEEIRVHAEVLNLVKNIFDELENSPKNRCDQTLMLYFSFYCFFLYKNQTIAMISKNLEEMEKVTKLTNKADPIVDVTPSDALDSCDIVSVYENLKVTGEKLKNLEKSLRILETIVASNPNPTLFKEVEPRKVYELVKNITMEYVLHSDGYNSFRSLLLAFNVGEFINDKYFILECDGILHRFLFFLKEGKNREEIICDLEKNSQSCKYLLQYYTNLSYFHVFHRNISLAYQYYKKAKFYWDSLNKENVKNLWSLEAGMELLLYKLLDVAKAMNFEMEMSFSYGPLIKAYNMIVTRYTSESQWTTYSMIILMEIFNNLVKMYHDLKMPREVRYFAKQSLILAQQHVIPIHSAKMLCYLAYADLWSERLDDCRVKVDGISDILLLDKTQKGPKIIEQKSHLVVPSVDDIMEGINEIMLDTPAQSAYNAISSPASPVLQCQTYKCPLFMSHTLCDCFHCTSLEYHKTVLSFYHLEALWYMHKGQITLAGSFFKGVFKLHESLSYKRKDIAEIFHNHLMKYSNRSQDYLKYDLGNTICCDEIKISASVSYIKFLVSSGAKEAAEKFCENALKKFTNAKIQFPHLYTEILLQKIGLICGRRENEKINLKPVNDETDLKVKTPEACVKNILIPKINSPRKKKFLPPKVIKFTLTDSELSVTPSKSTDSLTSARTPKAKVIPPSLRNIDTPKLKTTSRNNIFSGNNKKITPSENDQDRIAKMDENQQSLLSESSLKHSKQTATDLEDKTKLLTSRLRKKNVCENNSSDTSNITAEKDVQPVRRSRRNRT